MLFVKYFLQLKFLMCPNIKVPIYFLCSQIFIRDNQGGNETTVVQYIGIYGNILDSTNMKDFKRVSTVSTLLDGRCVKAGVSRVYVTTRFTT